MTAKRIVVAAVAIQVAFASSLLADDSMRVHFIDVGQGDATLVEFPCGAVLLDTGGEEWPERRPQYSSTPVLVDYLTEFFDSRPDLDGRLDLLVLTHPHEDHTRGVSAVVSRFRPRNVVHNNERRGSGIDGQRAMIRYARSTPGVTSWYVLERLIDKSVGMTNATIDPLDCGATDPEIRVLWGGLRPRPAGWNRKDHGNGNNHSIVVRIDFGDASILWTGDLEEADEPGGRAGIESLVDSYAGTGLLDVDVYQVGHHGSHNGTTADLVAAMTPEIAVISAGPANCERRGFTAYSHGHPRESVVLELEAGVTGLRATPASVRTYLDPGPSSPLNLRTVSKAVYSTGWDGTVVLAAGADGTWRVESLSGTGPCIQ